jgi:brefeldin A-inhibited guanine nucleotide-exchange protein
VVIAQGAFPDLVVCLTEFSKNLKFQKRSLQAIETLKSTIPRMLKTPECPLYQNMHSIAPAEQTDSPVSPLANRQTQEEQFWFPVLFAFHDVLMTGEDLEVRSQALNYLFDALIKYGGDFPPQFWDILWRQLLYPIFMVLRSRSEMTKVLNHEDLSVWLSTTMIQALRNMMALFTHYFDSLEYMLDRFLDLLALCICQENDTIARIGSNCLQTLILQNVTKFQLEHWHQIVTAFVHLFERTTAHQLFTATNPNWQASMSEDEGFRRPSQTEVDNTLTGGDRPKSSHSTSSKTNGTNGVTQEVEDGDRLVTASPTGENGTDAIQESGPNPAKNDLQQIVVTPARRRFFNKIITRCVLQLLMIETVNELFSNNEVYAQIPSPELLRLMALLKKSYVFAKRFNSDNELRRRLYQQGFMKQPPNLLKQESGSAATYVSILVRMYFDDSEERRASRADTEDALIP